MDKIYFDENTLCIGEKQVVFDNKILQIKIDAEYNRIYVLLEIPSVEKLTFNDFHNVYGFDMCGKAIWQISRRPKGDEAVYIMIGLKDGKLYANDFLGRRYQVNRKTGEIEKMDISK
jgi:hypothetical protein